MGLSEAPMDALGVHGMTVEQAEVRCKILESILPVMEKPFSDKSTGTGTNSVQISLAITGMHFTEHSVRLSDDSFKSLELCLMEYPVKNARDIGHVIGVIQYANSAFHCSSGQTVCPLQSTRK